MPLSSRVRGKKKGTEKRKKGGGREVQATLRRPAFRTPGEKKMQKKKGGGGGRKKREKNEVLRPSLKHHIREERGKKGREGKKK